MRLPRRQFEIVQEHALRAYPYECCGLFAGKRQRNHKGEMENVVYEIAPCENVLYEGREKGFEISYSEYLEVEREAFGLGYEIVGSYHSHLDSPAVPSNNDINFATPGHSMLIIALQNREPAAVTCWLRRAEGGFHQEEIRVIEP
ncbi:M67 family metallopeptidase [Prosthecochloris sp. N3]|uniref:M67 family metallopeptidase n=1 Tax=Prosthecochloris ethylica TaxID=2743976 RepID=A0ABR9XQ27_9CHLB|nr:MULTISPECIES: M67 family metallopeptidase [Prosthecochloris]MEC9485902.1 M67 family metallopeptidase [Prosthecochloris sp.]MBF0586525.1 M67 family metallopeptidase [Prosthecochloris ethylica]MBF0636138.1 M67 family metallopeptidase [Prosthecochloris ethylica]NUK47725.1 M67 family metallopeptidase [Prosthecochloris ethylica]RNA64387.1 M67 family peptidase [Prosthecochloris sp. ZM_2]